MFDEHLRKQMGVTRLMHNLRSEVRFRHLGGKRAISFVDSSGNLFEGWVYDESARGVGLEMKLVDGLTIGTQVNVENSGSYTIVRILKIPEPVKYSYHVGLQLVNSSNP
jgi:hypothetical protein